MKLDARFASRPPPLYFGNSGYSQSKRGSKLAATLLAYFDCNQNAKLAAQQLEIHVNTVRQRLATIEDLVGNWSNAVKALENHVALRLWNLGGA